MVDRETWIRIEELIKAYRAGWDTPGRYRSSRNAVAEFSRTTGVRDDDLLDAFESGYQDRRAGNPRSLAAVLHRGLRPVVRPAD
jgi:hypothetical protein